MRVLRCVSFSFNLQPGLTCLRCGKLMKDHRKEAKNTFRLMHRFYVPNLQNCYHLLSIKVLFKSKNNLKYPTDIRVYIVIATCNQYQNWGPLRHRIYGTKSNFVSIFLLLRSYNHVLSHNPYSYYIYCVQYQNIPLVVTLTIK